MAIMLKAASVALAVTALCGIGAVVASAAEPTHSAHTATVNSANAQWSCGFDFHNTSTIPMIFTGQSWPTGTLLGTVVLPGQSLHFEVAYDGGMMENSYLEFTPKAGYGAGGKIQFTLEIEGVANTTSSWTGEDGMSGFSGIADDRNIYVVDPDGTDITLDGSNQRAGPAGSHRIARALRRLDPGALPVRREDRGPNRVGPGAPGWRQRR